MSQAENFADDDFSFDEETASIIAELDESLKRANEELESLKGHENSLDTELDTSSLEAENFGEEFSVDESLTEEAFI